LLRPPLHDQGHSESTARPPMRIYTHGSLSARVLQILFLLERTARGCDTKAIGKSLNRLARLLLRGVQISLDGGQDLQLELSELLTRCHIDESKALIGSYRFNALQP